MKEHLKSLAPFQELNLKQLFDISNEVANIGSSNGFSFLRNNHINLMDKYSDYLEKKVNEMKDEVKSELSILSNQIEIIQSNVKDIETLLEGTEDNAYDCRNRCFKRFERDGDAIAYHNCLMKCPVGHGPAAAVIYKHINYAGAFVPIEYDADNRDLRRNEFNDMTSSIRLSPGWKLLVSEHIHHGGKRFWVTESIPDLRRTPIGNDTISSLIAIRK